MVVSDLSGDGGSVIVNLRELKVGMVETVQHAAMPDLQRLQQGGQDETWCLLERGKLGAICSLWLNHLPAEWIVGATDGQRCAALGHFFAQDECSGVALLAFATKRLRTLGARYVVGPLDGDTWHHYRLVTNPGDRPPFFLEYYTPCAWPAIFEQAGFAPIAGYRSAQTATAGYQDRSAEKFARRAAAMNLTIRRFDPAETEATMRALYALSIASFAQNLFYTPIDDHDFFALYRPLLPHLVPDLFLLAEHEGEIVGFVLAVPDYTQRARGEAMDTMVIKTLARHPARCYAGLGSYLAQEIHQRAAALGFRQAIHALMYDGNASRVISDKSAQTIRQYALYGQDLSTLS